MNTQSNVETQILCDRLEDLEYQVIKLSQKIKEDSLKDSKPKVKPVWVVGVVLTVVFLLGLNFSYQTDKRQISYDNNNLVELGLSCITLLSGIYSYKKYSESEEN